MPTKPANHTLYWVYAWDQDETEYNTDTFTRISDARRAAREMVENEGHHHAHIWFGNEFGAFTWLDPVGVA